MTPLDGRDDEILLADLVLPVVQSWRLVAKGTLGLTLIAAVGGGAYYLLQPTKWTASVTFRLVFDEAARGKYPDGHSLAPTDILKGSIVAPVLEKNGRSEYCTPHEFGSGLTVHEVPTAPPGAAEGVRLVQPEYQLGYVRSPACSSLPENVVLKTLIDIIEGWAKDSVERRGAMNTRMSPLTPAVFDQPRFAAETLVARADLIRKAVTRVIENIAEVQQLPGIELVRVRETRTSVAELQSRMQDLIQARLDPLMMTAAAISRQQSGRWVNQAIRGAAAEHRLARRRAEAYRSALREYSASTTHILTDELRRVDARKLADTLNGVLIERLMQMSERSEKFRQDLTQQFIAASSEAVKKEWAVERYRALSSSTGSAPTGTPSVEAMATELERIISDARRITEDFNKLYAAFSQTSFNGGLAIYRIERAPAATIVRGFTLRAYLFLLIGVAFGSLILFSLGAFVLFHGRALLQAAAARNTSAK